MGIVREWFKWVRLSEQFKQEGIEMSGNYKEGYCVVYFDKEENTHAHDLYKDGMRVADYYDALEAAKQYMCDSDGTVYIMKEVDKLQLVSAKAGAN